MNDYRQFILTEFIDRYENSSYYTVREMLMRVDRRISEKILTTIEEVNMDTLALAELATVKKNDDEKEQGRVKVSFDWQESED